MMKRLNLFGLMEIALRLVFGINAHHFTKDN